MDELKAKSEVLTDHIRDFLDTYYKLTKISVTEKTSIIASGSFLALGLCILGALVLFFLGIGIAIWLGGAINNRIAGYFIVAGLYILFMGILFLFRKKIIFPLIRNLIIRKMYE